MWTRLIQTGGGHEGGDGGTLVVGGGVNTNRRGCVDLRCKKKAANRVAGFPRDLSAPAAVNGLMINLESERSSAQIHVWRLCGITLTD